MLPIAMYLLQKEGQFLTGHDLFLKRVGAAYHAFLETAEVRPFCGLSWPLAWKMAMSYVEHRGSSL